MMLKWARKTHKTVANWSKVKQVLVPVCHRKHWYLLVFRLDMLAIERRDSLSRTLPPKRFSEKIRQFLIMCFEQGGCDSSRGVGDSGGGQPAHKRQEFEPS